MAALKHLSAKNIIENLLIFELKRKKLVRNAYFRRVHYLKNLRLILNLKMKSKQNTMLVMYIIFLIFNRWIKKLSNQTIWISSIYN